MYLYYIHILKTKNKKNLKTKQKERTETETRNKRTLTDTANNKNRAPRTGHISISISVFRFRFQIENWRLLFVCLFNRNDHKQAHHTTGPCTLSLSLPLFLFLFLLFPSAFMRVCVCSFSAVCVSGHSCLVSGSCTSSFLWVSVCLFRQLLSPHRSVVTLKTHLLAFCQ